MVETTLLLFDKSNLHVGLIRISKTKSTSSFLSRVLAISKCEISLPRWGTIPRKMGDWGDTVFDSHSSLNSYVTAMIVHPRTFDT